MKPCASMMMRGSACAAVSVIYVNDKIRLMLV